MSSRDPRTAAEWTALIGSSLILAIVVGVIVVQARQDESPAAPTAAVGAVEQVGEQYHLDVTVTNDGDETAANVQVSAELEVDGEVVATADQTIDFLSGSEEEDLVFVFEDDPRDGDLTVAVTGFSRP